VGGVAGAALGNSWVTVPLEPCYPLPARFEIEPFLLRGEDRIRTAPLAGNAEENRQMGADTLIDSYLSDTPNPSNPGERSIAIEPIVSSIEVVEAAGWRAEPGRVRRSMGGRDVLGWRTKRPTASPIIGGLRVRRAHARVSIHSRPAATERAAVRRCTAIASSITGQRVRVERK